MIRARFFVHFPVSTTNSAPFVPALPLSIRGPIPPPTAQPECNLSLHWFPPQRSENEGHRDNILFKDAICYHWESPGQRPGRIGRLNFDLNSIPNKVQESCPVQLISKWKTSYPHRNSQKTHKDQRELMNCQWRIGFDCHVNWNYCLWINDQMCLFDFHFRLIK